MYYFIIPSELCEHRRVFTQNPRTNDGRVVLTMRDLNKTRFSLGPAEIVNETDLSRLMQPAVNDTEDGTAEVPDDSSVTEVPDDSQSTSTAEDTDSTEETTIINEEE